MEEPGEDMEEDQEQDEEPPKQRRSYYAEREEYEEANETGARSSGSVTERRSSKSEKDQREDHRGDKRGDQRKKEARKDTESKRSSDVFSSKQQQLFLMEFLVDTVTIDDSSVDEAVMEGQTCITLKFLNFPPMEICEKDFDPGKETCPDKIQFNSGKSLMFAFNENQCDHPPPLSVEITISKKIEVETSICKIDIGTIKICISELFRQIVDIAKFKPDKLPASKSIKDCFMLIGPGKRTMGEVSIYLRLSCLGQNIVTEFQCGPDMRTSPFLFKSREGKKVYEFTGSESPEIGEYQRPKGQPGCGCIRPSGRGGQGDGQRSSPPARAEVKNDDKKGQNVQNKSKKGGAVNSSGDKAKPGQESPDKGKASMAVTQVNADPDTNCFVLKVGDKGMIPDRGKMILEFRAPKQKILPKIMPPYHEDVAVQTEQQKKGKNKGKGKNNKGKEKKKK